tara:strand:+ start:616 stop:1620 length:1005 start_codon:yes stop_codon:yes gene_type:complete
MPTATPFKALGAGNGFGKCLSRVDVSSDLSYTEYYNNHGAELGGTKYWVTLGGVSSGSASQAQINLSFANAMKLYWNMYSVKAGSLTATSEITSNQFLGSSGSSYGTQSGWPGDSTSVSASNLIAVIKQSDPVNANVFIDSPPKARASNAGHLSTSGNLERDRINTLMESSCSIGSSIAIIRMYNGSVDDENNFVGYGVHGSFATAHAHTEAYARGSNSETDIGVRIHVSSLIKGRNESGTDPDTGKHFDEKTYSCTLGGMPFIGRTFVNDESYIGGDYGSNDEGTMTRTLVAGVLSGTADASFFYDANGDGEFTAAGNGSVQASITDIDFWTY